jgi:hypothetical protein
MGDGHDGREFALLALEFREFDVVESGRSREEHRYMCKKRESEKNNIRKSCLQCQHFFLSSIYAMK